MRQVVLGAGPLGVSLRDALAAEDVDIGLFSVMGDPSYDMVGTSPDRVDGTDAAALARVCSGADVVYLCLNAHYVDWYALFPPRLEAAIDAAASVGATLVYHDNVYLYGSVDGPLTEDTPHAATTRKGRLRAEMAATVTRAVRSGRLQAALCRHVRPRRAQLVVQLHAGRTPLRSAAGGASGQRPRRRRRAAHAHVRVRRRCGTRPDDVGGAQRGAGPCMAHPAAPTLSHRQLLTAAFDLAGLPPRIRASRVSAYVVRAIGRFQRDLGEVAELLEQFDRPLVVSHARYERAFGANTTSHDDALRTTLDWYRRRLRG